MVSSEITELNIRQQIIDVSKRGLKNIYMDRRTYKD